MKYSICCCLLWLMTACSVQQNPLPIVPADVIVGAQRFNAYLPLLEGKRVAVFGNHTSMVDSLHLVDFLLKNHIQVTTVFAPEHGFRGTADAGQPVGNSVDPLTQIPILSLYGTRNALTDSNAQRFDVLLCDIQDVGLRFYTYYISMAKLMAFCADHQKSAIVLDRPNPNGHYVDGPILDMRYKSNVGWLPIPVVHGLTLGELARMANGEGWLPRPCPLTVIPCLNYTHQTRYTLPIAPSPNLPNMQAIHLYPSLCYFEATPVSVGRGTDKPFQLYGHPHMRDSFRFTPHSKPGAAKPPLANRLCHGKDLSTLPDADNLHISLLYLIDAYQQLNAPKNFFRSPFFEKLIGVDYVKNMIVNGKSAPEIEAMWKSDVEKFKKQRQPYLLYPE